MATNESDDRDIDVETRLNDLKQRLQEKAGGQVFAWESEQILRRDHGLT